MPAIVNIYLTLNLKWHLNPAKIGFYPYFNCCSFFSFKETTFSETPIMILSLGWRVVQWHVMEGIIYWKEYICIKLLLSGLRLKKPVLDKLSTLSKNKYEGKRLFILFISRRLRRQSWGSKGPWCSFKKSLSWVNKFEIPREMGSK